MADHFATHQRMPTMRELMARLGITSTNGLLPHLLALVRKGYLHWDRGDQVSGKPAKARAYEIVGLSAAIGPVVAAHTRTLLESAT